MANTNTITRDTLYSAAVQACRRIMADTNTITRDTLYSAAVQACRRIIADHYVDPQTKPTDLDCESACRLRLGL